MFGASLQIEKMTRLYQSVDQIKTKYGKHTLFLGSSFYAHRTAQHEGERGMLPERKQHPSQGRNRTQAARHSHADGGCVMKSLKNWLRRKEYEGAGAYAS